MQRDLLAADPKGVSTPPGENNGSNPGPSCLPVTLALTVTLAFLTDGCKVGPSTTTPQATVANQWTQANAVTNIPSAASDTYWWRQFDDGVLNELVETAHRNNPSLQAAGVRVLEARARLNKSIGNLFPQQQALSGDINYAWLNDGLVSTIPGVTRGLSLRPGPVFGHVGNGFLGKVPARHRVRSRDLFGFFRLLRRCPRDIDGRCRGRICEHSHF